MTTERIMSILMKKPKRNDY